MAKCYIVTWEVAAQDAQEQLRTRLRAYGTYCPINPTCWAIVTEQTAVQIRDHLLSVIATQDKLFVVRSGVEAAWRNVYSEKNTAWLKEHL